MNVKKNLTVTLLKTNDIVETKMVAFVIRYDENGEPTGINPAIQSDFMENLKK